VRELPHSTSSRKTCPRTREGNIFIIFSAKYLVSKKELNFDTDIMVYRYAVYELEYPTNDGRVESKILFIMYAPDVCDSKEKFIIATSKDQAKKKMQPFNKEVQVNDWADLIEENFIRYFKH
jgi:hypothetical protein